MQLLQLVLGQLCVKVGNNYLVNAHCGFKNIIKLFYLYIFYMDNIYNVSIK